MFENLLFWQSLSAVLLLAVMFLNIFYKRNLKKIEGEYNKNFEKVQEEVKNYEKELGEEYKEGGEIINTLIKLIDEYVYWVETKDKVSKLALQCLLEKLPEKVKDKVKITL